MVSSAAPLLSLKQWHVSTNSGPAHNRPRHMYNKAWYSEHIAPAYLTNSKLHLWRDEHKQNFFAWIFTYIHFFFLQRSGLKGGGGKTLRRRGRFLCGLYLLHHRWCLVGGWFHYSMSAPPRIYSKQQFTINNYHFMLSARIFLLFSFFFGTTV